MPRLSDPLPDDAKHLVDLVVEGWSANGGRWPIWQYVDLRAHADGLDADETSRGMPVWQYSYGPLRHESRQAREPASLARLTVHGLVHAGGRATDGLVRAFLAAVRAGAELQLAQTPHPAVAVPLWERGVKITERANMDAGTALSDQQMLDLLLGEPATWNVGEEGHPSWRWELHRTRLGRFREVRSGIDYLEVLESVVGVAQAPPAPEAVTPLALPDALDRLDLAWRLWRNAPLLRLGRARQAAELALPVQSRADFESRCSALADVISRWDVPAGDDPDRKTLSRLDDLLAGLPGGPSQAVDAVASLRRVVQLRNQQQHGRPVDERVRAALGLTRFPSDWQTEWDHVRGYAVAALRVISDRVVDAADGPPDPSS